MKQQRNIGQATEQRNGHLRLSNPQGKVDHERSALPLALARTIPDFLKA